MREREREREEIGKRMASKSSLSYTIQFQACENQYLMLRDVS